MDDDVIARTPAQIYQGMAEGRAKTTGRLIAVEMLPPIQQVTNYAGNSVLRRKV
jgi:hypothetical protein